MFFRVLMLVACLALFACKSERPDSAPLANASAVQPVDEAKAIFKTKVRRVEGDVSLLKGGLGDSWRQLRHGQNVVERDRIKTAIESEAVLGVSDGTILSITENSDVTISADMLDSLKKKISILVSCGAIHFDVQKQRIDVMEFHTGTATTAIRGTAGFVGDVGGQTVASLKEGRVEVIHKNGSSEEIIQNQTVLVSAQGEIRKMKLKSSGTKTLARAVDSLASVGASGVAPGAASSGTTISMAALQEAVQKFDDSYAERQKAFEAGLRFEAVKIADTVFLPAVTLRAQATPGIIVNILGESDTVPASGVYQKTLEWEAGAYGTKRFLASCSDGDVETSCFVWVTEYVAPAVDGVPADSAVVDSIVADSVQFSASAGGADLSKLTIKLGKRTEKIHLDLPAKSYAGNLKISLDGITQQSLSGIKSIRILRKGAEVKNFSGAALSGLSYSVPVSVDLNRIADFEVEATLKNGKTVKASKTYEVYCLRGNHMGKARNFVQYKTVEEEYDAIKKKGDLKKE